jgi:hypothetical protein
MVGVGVGTGSDVGEGVGGSVVVADGEGDGADVAVGSGIAVAVGRGVVGVATACGAGPEAHDARARLTNTSNAQLTAVFKCPTSPYIKVLTSVGNRQQRSVFVIEQRCLAELAGAFLF